MILNLKDLEKSEWEKYNGTIFKATGTQLIGAVGGFTLYILKTLWGIDKKNGGRIEGACESIINWVSR